MNSQLIINGRKHMNKNKTSTFPIPPDPRQKKNTPVNVNTPFLLCLQAKTLRLKRAELSKFMQILFSPSSFDFLRFRYLWTYSKLNSSDYGICSAKKVPQSFLALKQSIHIGMLLKIKRSVWFFLWLCDLIKVFRTFYDWATITNLNS